MGDPKRTAKKYMGPMHPWQKSRLDEEVLLKQEYGLKNKKEIWKQDSLLKGFIANYKKTSTNEQIKKEKQELLDRMARLGIIKKEAETEEILGLSVRNILERRLQTIVFKKSLAHSMRQARQFITHRHIKVGGRIVTSPSYLVSVDEQSKVEFVGSSPLAEDAHPERVQPEQAPKPQETKPVKEPKPEQIEEEASPVEIKDEDLETAKEPKEEQKPASEPAKRFRV